MEDQLQGKQFEVLLDIHTKKLHKEIQGLREEIASLKADVLRELKSSRDKAAPQPAMPAPQETKQVEAPPSQKSKPIDRNGVSPDDVSIEKIFYVGSN